MFHRLAVPSYFGGLPATYDYINDPATNGDPGVASPSDAKLAVSGHPNEGTYFVGFGDDGEAFNANRPHVALAQNTDFLDDLLHEDLAVPSFIDKNGIGSSTIAINTATDLGGVPIFVGPPGTPNTEAGLAPYFRITDQNDEDLVNGNPTNLQIVVTSVSPGGAIGTFYSGVLTLNLNTTPVNPNLRVHFGLRSSLAEMGPEALVLAGTTSAQEGQATFIRFTNDLARTGSSTLGAQLIGVDTALFTTSALTGSLGGGIGTTGLSTVRDVLGAIDTRLVARRAFTAVWTDGVNSFGGDFQQISIDPAVDGSYGGGVFMLRRGAYEISDAVANWTDPVTLIGEGPTNGPTISLRTTRGADLILRGKIDVRHATLATDSTTARYRFTASGVPGGFMLHDVKVETGAVTIIGGSFENFMEFEDVELLTNSGFLGASRSWEHTQEGHAVYRRCVFDQQVASATAVVDVHDVVDPALSSLTFEDCRFQSSASIRALFLETVTVPTIFRNCRFRCEGTTVGDFAVEIETSERIVFENCIFESETGQCVSILSSEVEFRNCIFRDIEGGVAAGSNPQMIVGSGFSTGTYEHKPLIFKNCTVEYGTSVIRNGGSDVPTEPWLELGGAGGVPANGPVHVEGMRIRPVSGFSGGSHKFTSVLLHAPPSADLTPNVYKDVTYDVGNQDSAPTGIGLAGVYDGSAPAYIEVGTVGSSREHLVVVENLALVNLREPTASHLRRLIVLARCRARGVYCNFSGTADSGVFQRTAVELANCEVHDMDLFPLNPPPVSTGAALLALAEEARVFGGRMRYEGASEAPATAFIHMGGNLSELHNFRLFVAADPAPLSVGLLYIEGDYCTVENCWLVVDEDPGATVMVTSVASATELRFKNNMVRWKRNSGDDILSISGPRSSVIGNQLLTTAATPPTATVGGTDTVDAENMLAADAADVSI